MTETEARTMLLNIYGEDREGAADLCFGDCCLRDGEKEALLTLIYGAK